jgi:hypothetical protein
LKIVFSKQYFTTKVVIVLPCLIKKHFIRIQMTRNHTPRYPLSYVFFGIKHLRHMMSFNIVMSCKNTNSPILELILLIIFRVKYIIHFIHLTTKTFLCSVKYINIQCICAQRGEEREDKNDLQIKINNVDK